MNPIFQSMMGGQMSQLGQLARGNPSVLLQQMAQTNPQARQVLQMIQGGANPQAVYAQMCRQRGIDPDQFLQMIQGYMR